MHVPDGFLDASTSVTTGLLAAGAVGLSLRKAEPELRASGPALAGLTSAFVFAVQMVNFPVGAGTSGHLMGGALAAVLVGPWTAVLCLTAVLLVQGLLFADGGLTALGTNVLLMGVVTVLVGYGVTRLALTVLPRRHRSVVPAAALGGLLSVPAAAGVFVLLYAIGGAHPIPLSSLMTAMLGWHLVIGIGEAVITAAVLGTVVAVRPDLVYAGRRFAGELVLADGDGARRTVQVGRDAQLPAARADAPQGTRAVAGVLGSVALLVAGGLSLMASTNPDGLEWVAEQLGFADTAVDSAVAGSPVSGYELVGLPQPWAAVVAGIIGVFVTVAVGAALTWLAKARRVDPDGHPRDAGEFVETTARGIDAR